MLRNTNLLNVYEAETIEDVSTLYHCCNATIHFKDAVIDVTRVNNDYYGNPLYHVSIFKDFEDVTALLKGCSVVYRCYSKKGFCTVQSYDIGKDIVKMLNHLGY